MLTGMKPWPQSSQEAERISNKHHHRELGASVDPKPSALVAYRIRWIGWYPADTTDQQAIPRDCTGLLGAQLVMLAPIRCG